MDARKLHERPAWEQYDMGSLGVQVALNWVPGGPATDRTIEWLNAHGIDAKSIPVPGWLELDDLRCQVRYLHWIRDANGVPLLADINGKAVPYGEERSHQMPEEQEPATRVEVVQLESPPRPWPEPAPTWADRSVES